MPYCSRCGVEVDNHVERCPLCDTPIQRFDDVEPGERRYPIDQPAQKPPMSDRVRRRIFWEVLTILYAIGVIVVIGSDLRVDAAIDWSLYPTISIVLAWVYTTLFVFFRKKPAIIAAGVTLFTVAYLAAIDLINGRLDWFFPVGLPIFCLFALIAALVALGCLKAKVRGLNVVAFITLGIGLFCVGVEFLMSLYQTGRAHFTWSIVVVLTLVPVSIILLFLHYRLRSRYDFRRFFHL